MTAVEVAAALGAARCHVEQRVVVRGVHLGRHPSLDPAQDVAQYAVDVRRAADRVLVLYPALVLEEIGSVQATRRDLVAVDGQLGLREHIANPPCALHHPRMRLCRLEQKCVEVAAISEQGLRGHRGHQVDQVGEVARCADGQAGERGHVRRAVRQCEPFLGLQHHRLAPQVT